MDAFDFVLVMNIATLSITTIISIAPLITNTYMKSLKY